MLFDQCCSYTDINLAISELITKQINPSKDIFTLKKYIHINKIKISRLHIDVCLPMWY